MQDFRYSVKIEKQNDSGMFRLIWSDLEKRTGEIFMVSSGEMTDSELKSWRKPENHLPLGQKLFRFLDGDARYLSNVLESASKTRTTPILYLNPCIEIEDWPFELLAMGDEFIVPSSLHLVRCVSARGSDTKPVPENRPLKILFMASSAIDVEPELNFEKEEETIYKVTEDLAIDIDVEDSGSLEGLKEKLAHEFYDIVHLSGHAGIDENGEAFFMMEDETGYRVDVTASNLYHEALIDNIPRLVFLSGSHTGETRDGDETVSFCRELVEKFNVPIVLGWGRSVIDEEATRAATMIYRELSRGKSILDAVKRARYDLMTQWQAGSWSGWSLLRLFCNMDPMNPFVIEGQIKKPKQRRLMHTFLKNSRVKILGEGFIGRKRPLQRSLSALKNNIDKTGVLILGAGGLGKSCLAGKICERFKTHHLIIVHGRLDIITLEEALHKGFVSARDEEGLAVLDKKNIELTQKLEELCVSSFLERNYFIVLDGFEQNIEGADKGEPRGLISGAGVLMATLLEGLLNSGKMTQLIITSRYEFQLNCGGIDLVSERLEPVYLTRFGVSEQEKKILELGNISRYPDEGTRNELVEAGFGNPRLMEWLDVLVKEMGKSEVVALKEKVKGKQEEFIREHVLRELVERGGEDFGKLIRWMSIYRRPVLKEGVKVIGETIGLTNWEILLEKGVGLGVVEYYQAERNYGVTGVLWEGLKGEIGDFDACHRGGFEYYFGLKGEMEKEGVYDPVLIEELIYHALGCGEEDIATGEGGELVSTLRERLAFHESMRVGEWILREKRTGLSTGNDATLLNNLGVLYWTLGDQRKAIGYYEQALAIWKKVYGEEHTQVAIGLNNLGSAYKGLGELQKAIGYFERALAIDETVYGKEHPSVAIGLNNLGSTYKSLGEIQKSILYYQQALSIDEKIYGKEHPDVAIGLNNLGEACRDLGEYKKAIDFFNQALLIDQKVYGNEHPSVTRELNNLGETFRILGELHKAIGYFEHALVIDEKVYGREHPNIATTMNNLGSAYSNLGEKKKAIGYFEQALSILMKFYGNEHPSVATIINNLGSAYSALGEKKKAIGYYEQALVILRKAYGEEHPETAIGLNNLGVAFKELGELPKAITYFEHALAIVIKVYGKAHPNVATTLNNLGSAYSDLGEKKKALGYYEQALSIDEKVYGKEHPSVARELNNLGSVYSDFGEKEKALGCYEHALAILKKMYGEEHPDVAFTMNNLGSVNYELNKKEQAANYFLNAYEILFKYFGPEHPSSLVVADSLQKDISKLINIEIEGGA